MTSFKITRKEIFCACIEPYAYVFLHIIILRNAMHNTQLKKCTCLWSFIQIRCPEKVVTICIKINFNRAQNLFLVLYTSQMPRKKKNCYYLNWIILFLKVNKKTKMKAIDTFFLKLLIYF